MSNCDAIAIEHCSFSFKKKIIDCVLYDVIMLKKGG